jgi:signal transduction histidine kinase/CheY-like chemotaxis protein
MSEPLHDNALPDPASAKRERRSEPVPDASALKILTLQTAILNSANFSSIATDARGVIQIFNIGAERMLGYRADEVLNKLTPADISDRDEIVARAGALTLELGTPIKPGFEALVFKASRGIEDIYELTYVRKDGSRFPAVVSVTALRDAREALIGYLLIGTDDSARNHLDKVLIQNNIELQQAKSEADKANLAKSDFLSRMSHELRTPLNAILGFAQLVQSGSPPLTDNQNERMLQITKAGWYLLELINEILDLAVIESGKLSLSMEPVSLDDVMHECRAMVESLAQKHRTTLVIRPFDNDWFIYADRTRVKQVLVNLLSNAIKYNRANSSVEVTCTAGPPDRIHISIKDYGEGLPAEKLAQLFQPFNRLGQESGNVEGTGMGLVVAKQLVELMGGRIGVSSSIGKGSEFWVELVRCSSPLHGASVISAKALPLADKTDAKPATLLYVEDNPANMTLVEHIIQEHTRMKMLGAHYGQLGITLARTHQPDVILMDIDLPDISGVDALKILNRDPATRHIPIMALSANAMPHDIERGLEAGFFRYLTKPVRINELLNALDDALRSSKTGADSDNATGGVQK